MHMLVASWAGTTTHHFLFFGHGRGKCAMCLCRCEEEDVFNSAVEKVNEKHLVASSSANCSTQSIQLASFHLPVRQVDRFLPNGCRHFLWEHLM